MEDIMWYPQSRRESLRSIAARIHAATTLPQRQEAQTDEPLKKRGVPEGTDDLVGKVIGKLTVIGFHRKVCPARMNIWIVQCECGAHEVRRQRWIKNPPEAHAACCRMCRDLTDIHKAS